MGIKMVQHLVGLGPWFLGSKFYIFFLMLYARCEQNLVTASWL